MNLQSIFTLGTVIVLGVADVVAEEIVAPSLKKGAIISISNGLLSRRDAQTYLRKFKNSPDPCKIDIIVREVVPIGSIESYLDSAGLQEASVEGFRAAPIVMYSTKGKYAELVLNAVSSTSGSGASYYLRSANRFKTDFLERGGGSGAVIEFISCEDHSWFGIINGYFYSPQDKLSYQFKDAPFILDVPKEGTTIEEMIAQKNKLVDLADDEELAPDLDPSQTYDVQPVPTPQADAPQPSAVEVPASPNISLQEIIRKRLNMMVAKPVDEALMQSFYAEKVTRLTDGKVVKRADIIDATRRMVEAWPRRGVSLISAGYNGRQLEMLLVFSFSDGQGNEDAQYGKITLDFDAEGKVNGMSEQYASTKHKPTAGFVPVEYEGEKTVMTVE